MDDCVLSASTTEFEREEAEVMESIVHSEMLQEDQVMESVIHSEIFREELQEMVAQQISDSLQQPASRPLYDLISLRQRYGQPDTNQKYGTCLVLSTVSCSLVVCFAVVNCRLSTLCFFL